ncbi:MAG: T9SS type A sorting domain-containing protein [Prevotella sp.]|nr:T9SS type A sorting domain-containing protein [Prevotella sp.]
MAKSLVAAALTVAFSTPVAANTATGSHTASVAFSKQADGIVMRTDDGSNGSNNALGGAIGIEYLEGKTEAYIKAAAVTSDTNLSDADPDKVFFLYNVKTGKFLNAGGYWGTHVSLKDYPLSLWAKTNDYKLKTGIFSSTHQTLIDFIQNLETGVGHYLGWMSGSDTDEGVFIDRKQDEDTHYGWVFELQNDGKNTYKIYTYATDSPSSSTTKYYLCANGDETDQDKNCGAFRKSYIDSKNYDAYSTWRVLTMAQISALLEENSDFMTSALDLSYRLDCPGFSRGDKDIQKWTVRNFSTGTNGEWRFGLEKLYNTDNTLTGSGESTILNKYDKNNLSSSTPYTFDGTTYTELGNYQRHLGKYFCADVKNMRGVIYQDVEIKAPGSYLIECKGYSTTPKAKIFASWFDKKGGTEDKALLHQNVLNQVSNMLKAEQKELHVSEQNMDYAGKNFYGKRKYINTVLIQVPKDKKQSENNYGVIRFGLIIGDDQNDTKVDAANEWTVFDDFRLLYASDDKGTDLILDEDRDNLDYLENCSNTYKNTVLHLNKTFVKDKWNSFVLPVSLNRYQFRQAFGANARLAILSNLTSSEIQFKTVDMDAKTMTDNAVVLDAYTPYIIFPTKIHTDNTKVSPAYKATLSTTDGESKTQEVVIKANHYDIPNVTFETNSANENDLTNMDLSTWTTKQMYSVGGDGTMEAHGTFARTFGKDATQDENGVYNFNNNYEIINDRDNLIGSYFFDNGNLYCSKKRVRGLRGFSCWFKPVDNPSSVHKLNLYIDGVANGTTGIDEVAFGDEEPTGKAAKGIYNMNGQLVSNGSDTTNLPAGMYIVNGKKCVVR